MLNGAINHYIANDEVSNEQLPERFPGFGQELGTSI
jgi:hypothetical protein